MSDAGAVVSAFLARTRAVGGSEGREGRTGKDSRGEWK